MNPRGVWTMLALAAAMTVCARGAETATVKSDKVNVRGQAVVTSEVITQLQKGETVTVLEEVEAKKPKKGEPAKWLKIQLPANTPVWVYAPYIETTNKTVNVSRVNLRSGPGENFSVLGRLERGTAVKEIRTVNNWMEVEAPPNTYAFVAAEYLDRAAPELAAAPPPPTTNVETNPPTPPQPAPTVVSLPPDHTPAPAVDEKAATTATTPATNMVAETSTNAAPPVTATTPAPITATTPAPQPQPVVEIEPKRTVSREGRVVISRSIQAPTEYALESLQTHRLINYLHSEEAGIKLKVYGGRKVIVSGEELIDVRWTNTPILEVETIHLVP